MGKVRSKDKDEKLNIISKQYQLFPAWGAIKIVYTHTAVYFNLGTFLFSTAIFWYTTGWRWSSRYLDFNITYPGFMAIILSGAILAGLLIYKFEMPSSFRFWFDQGYKHSTLLPSDLIRIENKIDQLLISKENRIQRGVLRYEKRKRNSQKI